MKQGLLRVNIGVGSNIKVELICKMSLNELNLCKEDLKTGWVKDFSVVLFEYLRHQF